MERKGSLSGGSPRHRPPWTETTLDRDRHLDRDPYLDRDPSYGKERAIRILLECILVSFDLFREARNLHHVQYCFNLRDKLPNQKYPRLGLSTLWCQNTCGPDAPCRKSTQLPMKKIFSRAMIRFFLKFSRTTIVRNECSSYRVLCERLRSSHHKLLQKNLWNIKNFHWGGGSKGNTAMGVTGSYHITFKILGITTIKRTPCKI